MTEGIEPVTMLAAQIVQLIDHEPKYGRVDRIRRDTGHPRKIILAAIRRAVLDGVLCSADRGDTWQLTNLGRELLHPATEPLQEDTRIEPYLDEDFEDDGSLLSCTHCSGEGTCDAGNDPEGNCPELDHPCHACNGSGDRRDQTVF